MLNSMTSWPSGLRRCVKAAVFWAWVRIPPKSLLVMHKQIVRPTVCVLSQEIEFSNTNFGIKSSDQHGADGVVVT